MYGREPRHRRGGSIVNGRVLAEAEKREQRRRAAAEQRQMRKSAARRMTNARNAGEEALLLTRWPSGAWEVAALGNGSMIDPPICLSLCMCLSRCRVIMMHETVRTCKIEVVGLA
jgi:hypothetical protein